MFHWQTGSEVVYFNSHFDTASLAQIRINIYDHYSDDGKTIRPDRRGLAGTWLDSGVNALSLLKCWLPFDEVSYLGGEVVRCEDSGLPIFTDLQFRMDGRAVRVTVDWRTAESAKYTELTAADGKRILIEHTKQTLIFPDGSVALDDMLRLERHYYNYFVTLSDGFDPDGEQKIHKVLFEVNQSL